MTQKFVTGSLDTALGKVPLVSPLLTWNDRKGAWKARWGIGRMTYKIDPGLYALGSPGPSSPVLVTANYKLTFDRLRGALTGGDFWILVLDTKGINVWCAAGKGTFGTEELVERIGKSDLVKLVNHREVILPQLGAPGVAAPLVEKLSGFRVVYGPIRAEDLKTFLATGQKATGEMRRMAFPVGERLALVPIELVTGGKYLLFLLLALTLSGGFLGGGDFWPNVQDQAHLAAFALGLSLFLGAVLVPVLLPWLPGRAFSVKGLSLSILGIIVFYHGSGNEPRTPGELLGIIGFTLLIPAITTFLAMNYTGCSTFTSLSAVRKEMRLALPWQIGGASLGVFLWLGGFFIS